MSRLKGYIFNNAGTPVEGATVTALEAGTTTAIGSTVESGSDGSWSFTSGLTGKNVDVKIESGSTVRYLKHDDHVQVEHMWVRSDTGNTVAPMRIENATNNASNLLLELVGDNSTRADGDEIYISFKMDDDGGNEHEFARITADATDVSNGNEDGQLRFGVSVAGTMTDVFTINATTAGVSDMTLDVSGDLTLDADGGDVFFKDGGTTFGSATNNSGNLIIKSGTTTALTFTGANVAVAGNATIDGDLTISGDDLVMGTNTAGMLLIADGTNFNPTSITSLSAISSVEAADTLLAIDDTDGALKKITRSTLVSGLASGTMTDVVDDSSPQLGGNLDTNSNNIIIDDAHFISDENNNEQIIFQTTSSAVNQFDVTNAATGNAPQLSATGGDTNIDLQLLAKGSGHVTIVGNTASGAIQFNCENNSHGQIVKAQPHSAGVTNVLLLPAGGDSTLVSLESTDTLTNKTLTSPKINEDVAVTSTATELNVLDGITAVVGELNALDLGSTAVGTAIASKAVILDSNKDYTGLRNFTITGELDAATLDISGNADIDGTLEADAITMDGTAVKTVGLENMWIPATAMTPSESNGCGSITSVETSSGRPDLIVLDFDKDSDEFAHFSVAMPKSWNEGTITFQAYWTSSSTNTGTVAWAMSGVSVGDNDTIDVNYGTEVVATAKAHSGTAEDLNISAVSGNLTVANAAADELAFFEIFRDVSADDHTADARLLGVKIFYTTDTSTDA